MGNASHKAERKKKQTGKRQKEKSNPRFSHVEVENERNGVSITIKVTFETSHGTTVCETLCVNPLMKLGDFKEDLQKLRNMAVAGVREQFQQNDLQPDHSTLEDLGIDFDHALVCRERV